MVTIDISDDQREYLEQLRVQLAAEHVGAYGHVRTRDALQYLIDQHRGLAPVADDPAVGSTAPAAADASPSATEAASAADEPADAEPELEDDASTTGVGDADTSDTAGEAKESDDEDGGDAADGDDDGESGGMSRLERMMGLLDDNEDKWEPVESEQGKYAVELPDGNTEYARTKDDVRAVLFKHYR